MLGYNVGSLVGRKRKREENRGLFKTDELNGFRDEG